MGVVGSASVRYTNLTSEDCMVNILITVDKWRDSERDEDGSCHPWPRVLSLPSLGRDDKLV